MTAVFPETASARSFVGRIDGGSVTPGRKARFSRRSLRAAHTSASCAHRVTDSCRPASIAANAVPHDPAPTTATDSFLSPFTASPSLALSRLPETGLQPFDLLRHVRRVVRLSEHRLVLGDRAREVPHPLERLRHSPTRLDCGFAPRGQIQELAKLPVRVGVPALP